MSTALLVITIFSLSYGSNLDLNSFEGHNVTCLLSCLPDNSVNSYSDFCIGLLSKVYGMCSSFDIATGRCQKDSQCKTECGIADWCYFGTGMVANCPGNNWNNLTTSALTIEKSCLNAEQSNTDNQQPQGYWLVDDKKVRTILLITFACK